MKFNQFGHINNIPYNQKVTELINLHFLDSNTLADTTANTLWLHFLSKSFPEAKSDSIKKSKLNTLLANSTQTVTDYIATKKVDATSFYCVALQLLDFEFENDFNPKTPLESLTTLNLYHHQQVNTVEQVVIAWYDLLCTYTKSGHTFLDKLTTKGYFTSFYQLPASSKPLFFNGKSLPIFDTSSLIFEVVYVESDLDTDDDGKADLLKVEVIRPKDTNSGLKVPVVYTASPYNQGVNDELGKKLTHNVDVPLKRKTPNQKSYADIEYHSHTKSVEKRISTGKTTVAEESFGRELSYTLNDYLLARGFAAVYTAGIGTKDSDGMRTCGSPAETASTVAVIEWLTGKRRAFTNKDDNIEIEAWWCNQNVAMTGKSYLGTLATAAATSGVSGLKTIISEAAISNWYDYYRDGGLVVAPGGFPGEDADVLTAECFSRKKQAADYLQIKSVFQQKLATITQNQDRETGNYNTFWDARNYLKNIQNIKCDVLMVHGLNDWNVKLRNVFNLYQALDKLPITKKIILHQGQHIYINNFQSLDFSDMINLWLSNKLYAVNNNADSILPNVLVQENTAESTWHTYPTWDAKNIKVHNFSFANKQLTTTPTPNSHLANFNNHLDEKDFLYYQKNITRWQQDLLKENSALASSRLIFKTEPLKNDLYLQGTPQVKLRVATNQDHGMLSLMLVDFGNAKRLGTSPTILATKALDEGFHWREDNLVEFKFASPTSAKMITKGHRNLQNRTNLWRNDELLAGTFYDLDFMLQPMFYHLTATHQLGLIIYSTDMEMTVRSNENISYSFDLAACQLSFDADVL